MHRFSRELSTFNSLLDVYDHVNFMILVVQLSAHYSLSVFNVSMEGEAFCTS